MNSGHPLEIAARIEQVEEITQSLRILARGTLKIANAISEIANASVLTHEPIPPISINLILFACVAALGVFICCYLFNRSLGWCESWYMRRYGTNGRYFPVNMGSSMELRPLNQLENMFGERGSSRQADQGHQESKMSTPGRTDQPSTSALLQKWSPEEKREAVLEILRIHGELEKLEWIDKRLEEVGLL